MLTAILDAPERHDEILESFYSDCKMAFILFDEFCYLTEFKVILGYRCLIESTHDIRSLINLLFLAGIFNAPRQVFNMIDAKIVSIIDLSRFPQRFIEGWS